MNMPFLNRLGSQLKAMVRTVGTGKKVCIGCKKEYTERDWARNHFICPSCGKYNRMGARSRIALVADDGSFTEMASDLVSVDFLNFPGFSSGPFDKRIHGSSYPCKIACRGQRRRGTRLTVAWAASE